MKKLHGKKWRLQQEETYCLKAQKKLDELRVKKSKTIIESPTQSPLPSSPDLTPEKMNPPEKSKPSSKSSSTASLAEKNFSFSKERETRTGLFGDLSITSERLFESLGVLKKLVRSMQTCIINKKTHLRTTRTNFENYH